ncbi:WecB/TagA/CpsF family glycosyltransferase [Roseomonas populi]|uniref:WecB/TagA/CpsF family glycosyltransferase n=1 Tax=Roseomonas populi TaxID=3121582 RepID=A0ABT1X5R1_9PROT|nr:WecB/TagA/CpsF family glycosyltransferase [Roseomonas pecuniae]MCR0982324.1 WecB/TagA/CpsF family glycosyltransferase [Roseomonas pecuniae]
MATEGAERRASPRGGAIAAQRLLHTRLDMVDLGQALSIVAERPAVLPFAYVVTPNADHLLRLESPGGEALRAVYENAWLSLLDSRVLRLLAARRGYRLTVVPGSDLAQALFRTVIRPDTPVTLIGGGAAVAGRLRASFGLRALAHHEPPMGFIDDPAAVEACVRFVLEHPARFVLLCVGSPRQELLAARIAATGRATGLGLCLGAAVEFVAGVKRRAPRWVQRAHLEWLHRLASEPRRLWRRYLLEAPRLLSLMRRLPPAPVAAVPGSPLSCAAAWPGRQARKPR